MFLRSSSVLFLQHSQYRVRRAWSFISNPFQARVISIVSTSRDCHSDRLDILYPTKGTSASLSRRGRPKDKAMEMNGSHPGVIGDVDGELEAGEEGEWKR